MRIIAISALLVLLAGAFEPRAGQAPTPVAGKDYVEISNGRPLDPAEGVIVVEEFFNYICPACNAFEPLFVAGRRSCPRASSSCMSRRASARTSCNTRRPTTRPRASNVAEKSHAAVYEAIHRARTLPAEGQRPDEERDRSLLRRLRRRRATVSRRDASFAVDLKVRRAAEHMTRTRIPSTPSVVINGRYLVRGERTRTCCESQTT